MNEFREKYKVIPSSKGGAMKTDGNYDIKMDSSGEYIAVPKQESIPRESVIQQRKQYINDKHKPTPEELEDLFRE